MGREQTEVDALATLRPDELTRIVTNAIAPFYDATLAHRVWLAKSDWEDRAREALDEQLGDEHRAALHGHLAEQLDAIRAQLEEIESQARLSTEDLEIELPPIEIPEPEIDESLQGKPLLSSRWSWAEQTRALIERKRYINGAGDAAMIRPERTKPWRRRHLRRPDPEPDPNDESDGLPPEDPNPPLCRHCLQADPVR